jgi:hypothetical protein
VYVLGVATPQAGAGGDRRRPAAVAP